MSDCPWRYLTADGRTVRCTGHGDAHWTDVWPNGIPMVDHARDDWPHILGWEEDDPCAWDATCTNCEGDGWVDTGGDPGYDTKTCPPCGGAGMVDTIPPALIGPGSKLEQPDGSWAYVLDNYGPGNAVIWDDATRSGERVNVSARIIDRDAIGTIYEVLRAVPPAGDTT